MLVTRTAVRPTTTHSTLGDFFDLSKEPVVLAHPDMGARHFTFEMADMYADNFGYVGKRTTGSTAGAFLIAALTGRERSRLMYAK